MMLAGIPVPDKIVLDLAGILRDGKFDETAKTLEDAYDVSNVRLSLAKLM
jgi:hypothetical protein